MINFLFRLGSSNTLCPNCPKERLENPLQGDVAVCEKMASEEVTILFFSI
uniref:Uncharacterized protein n=1 Tax=Anguilla anguilla TaxID=7936 RepID=A0A0E9RP31_ANGAN